MSATTPNISLIIALFVRTLMRVCESERTRRLEVLSVTAIWRLDRMDMSSAIRGELTNSL